MWKNNFETLLNSSKDTCKKDSVLNRIDNIDVTAERFSVSDVCDAIKCVKLGKSTGMDNMYGEHFKFADDRIFVLLSILFNTMIIHNFIPKAMLDAIIVPLIKDKLGNISDKDNYRPLALTCVA